MVQILGAGSTQTSTTPKTPVIERAPAKVFFEYEALAASAGRTLVMEKAASRVGTTVGARVIPMLPKTPTILIFGLFYSKSLGNGELSHDQLYSNIYNGMSTAGAFSRADGTVIQKDYVTEYELREIAKRNGTVRTRVRFRTEKNELTGEIITKSYLVGEGSGLDRVRVRAAKRLDEKTWSFEDLSFKGKLVWSTDTKQGKLVTGWVEKPIENNKSTVHDANRGGYTSPPTPMAEPQKIWEMPNPAPEPLPPLPGTPIPEEQGPHIETLPINELDFNDFIIVDPMGVVPAIYVYFQKAPIVELEVDYYGNFEGRSREGLYEVDHIPSKEAVRIYLKGTYPNLKDGIIEEMTNMVAAVAIPVEVHRQCSETYGGRNNSKYKTQDGEVIPQKVLDASNLEAAVDANWDANAECLKDLGYSNEQLEEVRSEIHRKNRGAGLY